MSGKKVITQSRPIIEEIIKDLGYELIDLEYKKTYNGMVLTVTIDKDGGVSINDCEVVSKALDVPLDNLNVGDNSYSLNVSSPGIDRPLKNINDFKRNLNKEIKVKLYSPINNKKEFEGTLLEFDTTSFKIKTNSEQLTFEIDKTANIVPVIKF